MFPDWKPSFIALEVPIPAKECGDKLLGRVVTDMRNPTHDYKPEDPSEYLKSYSLEVWDADWNTFAEHNRTITGTLAVGKILGLSGNKSSNATDTRKGGFVRTRRLTQHKEAKKTLMASKHADDVLTLLEENDSIGYLAVGYKSSFDGTHAMEFGEQTAFGVKAAVPAAEAVQAMTEGAVHFPASTVNPTADLEVTSKSTNQTLAHAIGEQIFAVQYRPITLRSSIFGSGKKEVRIGPLARVKFPAAVFGDGEEEMEILEDDDVLDLPEDDDGTIMASEVMADDNLAAGSQLVALV
jgi:hypothetical protein